MGSYKDLLVFKKAYTLAMDIFEIVKHFLQKKSIV